MKNAPISNVGRYLDRCRRLLMSSRNQHSTFSSMSWLVWPAWCLLLYRLGRPWPAPAPVVLPMGEISDHPNLRAATRLPTSKRGRRAAVWYGWAHNQAPNGEFSRGQSKKRGDHWFVRFGVYVRRQSSRSRKVRRERHQVRQVRLGHRQESGHIAADQMHGRAMRPWLCHVVSQRSLRHDRRSADQGEAPERRAAHRAHAEFRRGLAIYACSSRRGYFRHHLPGHGPSRRARCRHQGA